MCRQTSLTIFTTHGMYMYMYILWVPTHCNFPPPSSGRNFELDLNGQRCSLASLLEELYQKAGTLQLWSLVRHMAGVLEKTVEDLGTVCMCVCVYVHAHMVVSLHLL